MADDAIMDALREEAHNRTGRLVSHLRELADLTEALHERGYIVASVGTRHDSSTNESIPVIDVLTPDEKHCGSASSWDEWRQTTARLGLPGWD